MEQHGSTELQNGEWKTAHAWRMEKTSKQKKRENAKRNGRVQGKIGFCTHIQAAFQRHGNKADKEREEMSIANLQRFLLTITNLLTPLAQAELALNDRRAALKGNLDDLNPLT
jgi:hypothetical protein